MGLNRKQFIESHGALCDNPGNWSFINEKEKFIIFGAWESKTKKDGETLIFSKSWEFKNGRKSGNYKKSREHIRMIEDGGFKLKTFAMVDGRSEEEQERDTKAAWIKDFTRELEDKTLRRDGDKDWYADPIEFSSPAIKFPEEANIDPNALYPEGAVYTIQVNGYERNRKARQRCLDHHGYSCAVCKFDFEKHYGDIGKGYIHVHHKTPIRVIGKEYQIDPIKELIPVCPNCHAMIHQVDPPYSVKDLKEIMKSQP